MVGARLLFEKGIGGLHFLLRELSLSLRNPLCRKSDIDEFVRRMTDDG